MAPSLLLSPHDVRYAIADHGEMTVREIAPHVGFSEATVRRCLYRWEGVHFLRDNGHPAKWRNR